MNNKDMENKIMIGKEVRFQGFKIYEGWKWRYGGDGIIVAETETAYRVKTGWLSYQWVDKHKCEEIWK